MKERLRVFTIADGRVEVGARIDTLQLKGAGITIPAILIGEEGRGRERGVIPVANPPQVPCPDRGKDLWFPRDCCEKCGVPLITTKVTTHPNDGMVTGRLLFAEIGQTKAGKPKFISAASADTEDRIIVVFRTPIGYRGSNEHTGDRTGWKCTHYGCDATGSEMAVPAKCPRCGTEGGGFSSGPVMLVAKFPGELITEGHIAEGIAGRMGGGEQIVAIMPKDTVFRTGYSGRRYGAPLAHYYKWDGGKLLSATWEERATSDIF